jgi:hypothetical protein
MNEGFPGDEGLRDRDKCILDSGRVLRDMEGNVMMFLVTGPVKSPFMKPARSKRAALT